MSDQLSDFIRACVRSVWALELLLFLRRNADRAWDSNTLVRELRSSERAVEEALATFERAGLVVRDGDAASYKPAAPDLDRRVDLLATAYRDRPSAVIRAIVASPNDRLQAFADAFRLKKE